MCWYYIRKDPIDFMIEGHIVDAGGNYQLINDVRLPTIFSIYCTQKVYMILQTWRKQMPKDISDEELLRKDMFFL